MMQQPVEMAPPQQQQQHAEQQWVKLVPPEALLRYGAAPAENVPRVLWIGGLLRWMSEDYISWIFNKTGELESVQIIRDKKTGRSRGFGYLKFITPEAAQKMLSEYNKVPFSERSFHFRMEWVTGGPKADLPEHLDSDEHVAESDIRSLWLADLHSSMNKSFFDNLFNSSTQVVSVKVTRSRTGLHKGYGFLHFSSSAAAKSVLVAFNGRQMPWSDRKFKLRLGKHTGMAEDGVRFLWIGDLYEWMDEDYLRECFNYALKIVSVRFLNIRQTREDKVYGLIELRSNAAALVVRELFNGKDIPSSERKFQMEWASHNIKSDILAKAADVYQVADEGYLLGPCLGDIRGDPFVILNENLIVYRDRHIVYKHVNQLLVNVADVSQRSLVLIELAQNKVLLPGVAQEAWDSFGFMTVCLQVLVDLCDSRSFRAGNLSIEESVDASSVLTILQYMAYNTITRELLVKALIPMYVSGFIQPKYNSKPYKNLRLLSLGVACNMLKDPEMVPSLTEKIPFLMSCCLTALGSKHAATKTTAAFFVVTVLNVAEGREHLLEPEFKFTEIQEALAKVMTKPPCSKTHAQLILHCFTHIIDDGRNIEAVRIMEKQLTEFFNAVQDTDIENGALVMLGRLA